MSGWTMPVQQASFKGVQFDVIAVDETFDKAIAEHAYPFVNGADLEDMGLNPQTIKLQAVCFGEGYYTDYKKLLNVVQQRGADVLVHPIRGRIPNMILVSANLRHDAENVNYVALDLTFGEAIPLKPIFVFEHSLLAKIDRYLNLVDKFIGDMLAWWVKGMEVVAFAHNAKSRLLSQWSAIFGCFEQLNALFELNQNVNTLPVGVSKSDFQKQGEQALQLFYDVILAQSKTHKFNTTLGVKAEFNELMRDIDKVLNIPRLLVTGQHQRITPASQFFAMQKNGRSAIKSRLSVDDVKNLNCALHLISCNVLAKTTANIIETYAENLTPTEIEYITQQTRLLMLKTLNFVRELQHLKRTAENAAEPNNGLYTASYVLAEGLRNMASELMQIAVTTINQKPPLIVKEVAFNGTLQQVAHDFYRDYRRSSELLRLNPQIRQPNWIEAGTLLNCYSE
ncbi:DNA circularization N-terminal domain-containing protein [Glaesserella parasuis]|nr:DNA circularization N-terminal domain-containing protein [Glaesserella parasuis]MCT8566923.1 DNA circularization N-terminal domain-containing protein [Glaesserella parasuis]MCT8582621.1 DNA circularization N-terminal domain-containing protein [Glaesserella parasuis]MCT8586638.1 DNA circularization N-terminal domain-containing protein [Glaesserella parasuis]MCT8672576.1 DNA circularization N-terminal domain-containing protein [Glaesserella parasuis]